MTCRADTDGQTHRHTDKQTEIAKTEGPIDFFFGHFFLDFFINERSNNSKHFEIIDGKTHRLTDRWIHRHTVTLQ